jgi:Ca2+-binding RTX toxin-like protein
MTTFTGSFSTPGPASTSASGNILLALNVDAAAGARAGSLWGHVTGTGTITNYVLRATNKPGFPHQGAESFSIADIGNFIIDLNSGPARVMGAWGSDTVRFDGNPLALDPSVTFAEANAASNGLNLDGTQITGVVTVSASGLSGPLTVPLTSPLTGSAVPTLYNLANMSAHLEYGTALTSGWTEVPDDSPTDGGFKAITVKNADSSQVVITFRGTVAPTAENRANDPEGVWSTLKADLSLIYERDPGGEYTSSPTRALREFIAEAARLLVDVKTDFPGAQITLTGHSLGGMIAQLVGKISGYSTVAFDAPGGFELYGQLLNELDLAKNLNSTTDGNVNIRVVGDAISLVGSPINTVTLRSVINPYPDNTSNILNNHKIEVVLAQLLDSEHTSIYQGTYDPTQQLLYTLINSTEDGASENYYARNTISFHVSIPAGELKKIVDPSSGTVAILTESGDSPAITSVAFLADPNISTFKVWSQVAGAWSSPQTVAAGDEVSFGPDTHTLKFQAYSATGQVVLLPDNYLFAATYASSGQLNANLQTIQVDSFNGINVQTPVPGQTTLTVSGSFNYTDAGNGNLTVNGTSSGNDTILLGSGNKTVNLGGGNDFVMVKSGLTGNIVIHGGLGSETILAGAANVTMLAGSGNILFIGGDDANANAGFNTIDYSAFAGAVNVNLATGIIQTGNGAIQTLVNIENVSGSPSGDTLAGDTRANTLLGGAGNDRLTGGGGNDRLDGGLGTDTAVYSAAAAAFALLSYNGTVAVLTHGADGDDRLQGVENIQFTDKTVAAGTAAAFDPWEYLASYADLIRAFGANPQAGFDHYVDSGFVENRATNLFDPVEYLASNADLIRAFGFNPLAAEQHYVQNGFNEHRATTSFDPVEYLASNADLIRAFGFNPLAAEQHYVQNGFNEHRATTSFDPLEYLASNGDLIRAFGLNLAVAEQHYVQNGFNEHRATASFDPLEYLASNGDLIHAFGLNLVAAGQHYVVNGFNEHRATTSFDPLEYLASNGDLIHAFGLNLVAAEQHYVVNGFNEHRTTTSFDPLEYLASNGDLIHAFGLNLVAAEQHYVVNGFNEHRAIASFDAAQYLANYADLTAAFGPNNLVAAEQHYITNGFNEGRTDKAPVITGTAGADTLVAKNGAIMTGGAGADKFVFNFPLQKSAIITDFAAGADHLQISAAGFGHGLAAGGGAPLVTAATEASASHAGTAGYFIFDNAGTVWWDSTGGSGADAVALAKLTGVASLHASDFLLV